MTEEDAGSSPHPVEDRNVKADLGGPTNTPEPDDTLVTLNVGGCVVQTWAGTLRGPGVGRLARLSPQHENYMAQTGQYFFDRDPDFFSQVIRFYRTGELHIPDRFCARMVCEELEFWELPDTCVGECCWRVYNRKTRQIDTERMLAEQFTNITSRPLGSHKNDIRATIWNILECPTSSVGAKVWAILSITLLLVSILCYALTTLPKAKQFYRIKRPANGTDSEALASSGRFLFTVIYVDMACLAVFSIELLLRLYSAPSIWKVCKSFLFICDMLFLVPGWTLDAIILSGDHYKVVNNEALALFLLHFVTISRLFRILRLAWMFRGMRILMYVLKASLRELGVLSVFLFTGTMVFGFLIYSAEVAVNNDVFDSAFRGFWWAIITMTTVGYGDMYPVSIPGYIIAGVCAISGLLLIAMPIPIIATNFHLYYGFQERDGYAMGDTEPLKNKGDNSEPPAGKYTHNAMTKL